MFYSVNAYVGNLISRSHCEISYTILVFPCYSSSCQELTAHTSYALLAEPQIYVAITAICSDLDGDSYETAD